MLKYSTKNIVLHQSNQPRQGWSEGNIDPLCLPLLFLSIRPIQDRLWASVTSPADLGRALKLGHLQFSLILEKGQWTYRLGTLIWKRIRICIISEWQDIFVAQWVTLFWKINFTTFGLLVALDWAKDSVSSFRLAGLQQVKTGDQRHQI